MSIVAAFGQRNKIPKEARLSVSEIRPVTYKTDRSAKTAI